MTVNRIVSVDLPPPLAARGAIDTWNSASAELPGLANFLQPSTDSFRVESDGLAALYDRKWRAWWKSADEVEPATLGPALLSEGTRYCLEFPGTSGTNPLRSPDGLTLPDEGTVLLIADLGSDDPCVFFASTTTTGNYVKLQLNASGEIEAIGASGATLAKTADLTPYSGPMLVMFSWSASACKISVNGTVGGTTGGAYTPNDDPVDLGVELEDGAKLYAAAILDVDFHASAHDTQRAAYVVTTGLAFSTPFEIAWDFADLGAKRIVDINPATVADGNVTSITDQASGIVFTEALAPPSKASADFNGHPSITFVSADSEKIRNTAFPASIPVGVAESELIILVDQLAGAADTSTMTLVGYGVSGAHRGRNIRRVSDGSANVARAATNNTGGDVDASIDFSGIHVVGARWTGSVEEIWANGTLEGSISVVPDTLSGGRFAIGCSPSSLSGPVGFSDMKLARLFLFAGITNGERDLVHGKLAFLGGIQSLLPDGHPYNRATFV